MTECTETGFTFATKFRREVVGNSDGRTNTWYARRRGSFPQQGESDRANANTVLQ